MFTSRKRIVVLAVLLIVGLFYRYNIREAFSEERMEGRKTLLNLSAVTLDGKPLALKEFKGKVLLIVNTASKCGFTAQYEDLQTLYTKYKEKGFEILGFPSNDFLSQEPGTNAEISRFCKLKYGVSFPMFEKGPVKGKDKQPVYKFLTEESGEDFAGEISWNFEKFLIDRQGMVRARFGSFTNPESSRLTKQLEELLQEAD